MANATQMNLLVQSVTMVIAYFSTPQAIFHFDRNSKSFVLSVLLVIVVVKLINHALSLTNEHDWGQRRLKAWIVIVYKKRRPIFSRVRGPTISV
jgi:hypothetical protein